MRISMAAPIIAMAAFFTGSAFCEQSNGSLQASIIGSVPGLTIGGIASASTAWTTSQSNVSIKSEDQGWEVEVQLQNLVLASGAGAGTTGSVRAVKASIVCGGSGGSVTANTPAVSIDRAGNAQIRATVALPGGCRAPVVLVRSVTAAGAGSFIASTGLPMNANSNDSNSEVEQ